MHAGINLYSKIAVRLRFASSVRSGAQGVLARVEHPQLDMRAAPYDFTGLKLDHGGDWMPVKVETAARALFA